MATAYSRLATSTINAAQGLRAKRNTVVKPPEAGIAATVPGDTYTTYGGVRYNLSTTEGQAQARAAGYYGGAKAQGQQLPSPFSTAAPQVTVDQATDTLASAPPPTNLSDINPGVVAAPSGTNAQDLASYYAKMAGAIGAPGEIQATQVAGLFSANPVPVEGLPDQYYQSQKESLKEKLRQDFFGPVGTVQKVASQEAAAGRLGSGVGKRIIEETAMKPFAQESTNIDSKVLQAQLEERSRVQGMNADQYNKYQDRLAQLKVSDSNNLLAASQANAQLKGQYDKLMTDLYSTDFTNASKEKVASLDASVREYEAALNSHDKNKEIELNYSINSIKNALTDKQLNEETRSNLAKELLARQQNQIDFFKAQSLFRDLSPTEQDSYNTAATQLGQPPYKAGGSQSQVVGGYPGQDTRIYDKTPIGGHQIGTDGYGYQKVQNGWIRMGG